MVCRHGGCAFLAALKARMQLRKVQLLGSRRTRSAADLRHACWLLQVAHLDLPPELRLFAP